MPFDDHLPKITDINNATSKNVIGVVRVPGNAQFPRRMNSLVLAIPEQVEDGDLPVGAQTERQQHDIAAFA